jgi:hypothetical protein
MAQIQNAQNQNALAQYQLGSAQRAEQGQTALGQAYGEFYGGGAGMGGAPGAAPGELPYGAMKQTIVNKLSKTAPHLIPAEIARISEMEQKALLTKETQGKIDAQAAAQIDKSLSQFRQAVPAINDADSAVRYIQAQYADPVLGKVAVRFKPLEQTIAETRQRFSTPEGIQQWKIENAGITGDKLIDMMKQTTHTTDLGGQVRERQMDYFGKPIGEPTYTQKTATQGEILRHQDAKARLAAESATGQLTPATLDFAAETFRQTGQMPITGIGKNAAGLRTQILNRATELANGMPAADLAATVATNKQDIGSRTKAVKDFSTGIQGRQVNAFNTAIDHLSTMDKLSDALQNNDFKAINALGNTITRQTGMPPPTNFDAAKQIVTAEIIKAVVASGGGVTERQEAERNFSTANSPAQLKGVMNTYKELLGGQLKSSNLQYENTTGRKDFYKKLTPDAKATLSRLRGAEAPAGGVDTNNPLLK